MMGILIMVIPPIITSATPQRRSALRPAPSRITRDAITYYVFFTVFEGSLPRR